jgi:GTP pyrophosphokinase
MVKGSAKPSKPPFDISKVRSSYANLRPTAQRLLDCLTEQLVTLIAQHNIALAVPIESRVKTLESIEDKFERKAGSLKEVVDLNDLVGVRLILLFKKDLATLHDLVDTTFDVVERSDSDDLPASQFGYQSTHFVVRIPKEWLKIPSYADLGELKAELQVRTLAQHMWAAASHKLQYKREGSVPPPIRRTIHRVSALLETVDLEFDRVLSERDQYVSETDVAENSQTTLNVDLIAKILSEYWPAENISDDEQYDRVQMELNDLGVKNISGLRKILDHHKDSVLEQEKETVSGKSKEYWADDDLDRYERGVFFTHSGLTRKALRCEFGDEKVNEAILAHKVMDDTDDVPF